MADQFTEVTHKSWGERIKNSLKGILVGVLLIIGGVVLLFWNEGRTVNNKRALIEGQQNIININGENINEQLDGKLVHLTGFARTPDTLTDTDFGINIEAIRLSRNVEMYQWDEQSGSKTKKKVGGSEETTSNYTYVKKWSPAVINSQKFKIPENHENPLDMLYEAVTKQAADVSIGAFVLPTSLINKISNPEPLDKSYIHTKGIANASMADNYIYVGKGALSSPLIGDIRITFSVVKPQTVSIVAKQSSNSFEPYITGNGNNFLMLETGTVSSDIMFQHEQSKNKLTGWLLRLLGFLLISGGFGLILSPFKVMADVVPFIGSIVGAGVGLVSVVIGLAISLIVMSISWIYFRPVTGISLLVIGFAAFIYFIVIVRRRKKKHAA